MPPLVQDSFPPTPGKVKMERSASHFGRVANRWLSLGSAHFFFWSFVLAGFMFYAVFHISPSRLHFMQHHSSSSSVKLLAWGGRHWEKQVKHSAQHKSDTGVIVLVTGAAGFVGTHVSLALKRRGDGVVGIDNFNNYYDPSLKRARQSLLDKQGIFVVEGDINDDILLKKLLSMIPFTHVVHLAAQAGVRYAMENPGSYVHSNIAGLVTLFECCKDANPQPPAIIWASSSSVYGLNSKTPFSETDRTDQPASLYAATKKAGEEIAHTYNHIYGLSITGLRFFTVYGPWGRPDMAYFSFTKSILQGKPIDLYQGPNKVYPARDFTYIDDVVRGCLGALDTAKKSRGTGRGTGTGTGDGKNSTAQLRILNLGNTSPVPVTVLVNILEKYLRRKAVRNIVRMPRNGDVPFTHANISLARAEFGYAPTTDLAAGLKRFVKWYMGFYESHPDRRFHE